MEQFKLAAHMEARPLPSYSLVLIKKDPALRPSDDKSEPNMKPGSKPQSQAFQHVSMVQLALYLSPPLTSRPVLDRKGLAGGFDFELDFGPYILDADGKQIVNARGAIDSEGAVIQALWDQLGLALKSDRAPFQVLVIDHVEKTPAGN
jgi:uncharacterized protein (TIGR03435 family)